MFHAVRVFAIIWPFANLISSMFQATSFGPLPSMAAPASATQSFTLLSNKIELFNKKLSCPAAWLLLKFWTAASNNNNGLLNMSTIILAFFFDCSSAFSRSAFAIFSAFSTSFCAAASWGVQCIMLRSNRLQWGSIDKRFSPGLHHIGWGANSRLWLPHVYIYYNKCIPWNP